MRENKTLHAAGVEIRYISFDKGAALSGVEINLPQLTDAQSQNLDERIRKYQLLVDSHLPKLEDYDSANGKINFTFAEGDAFVPVAGDLHMPVGQAQKLATEILSVLQALHYAELAVYQFSPELVFWNKHLMRVVIIPAFWLEPSLCDITPDANVSAPELAGTDTRPNQPQADLYAMGAFLWQLLSGSARNGTEGLSFVEAFPSVPNAKEWDEVLDGCLKSNPSRRYSSLSEMAAALAKIDSIDTPSSTKETGTTRSGDDKPDTTKSGQGGFRLTGTHLAIVAGIVVVACLIIYFGYVGDEGGCRDGFASTTVCYQDRDYASSSWTKDRTTDSVSYSALGTFGPLYAINGVDSKNYWIGDKSGKIFRVRDGHWEFIGLVDGAQYPSIAPLDGDTAFIAGQNWRLANNKFSIVRPEGITGFKIGRSKAAWATTIASDYVLLSKHEYKATSDAYIYQSGKFKELAVDKHKQALVHRSDNSPMAKYHVGFVTHPSLFNDRGLAYGLWVNYVKGSIHDVWIGRDDVGVFVVFVSSAGQVIFHRVGARTVEQNIGSTDAPTSLKLIKVWGVSAQKYWVMDSSGTVWERSNDAWRTVVRGLYEDDIDFSTAWVTPEGSVLALTDDALYRLE